MATIDRGVITLWKKAALVITMDLSQTLAKL